VHGGAPQIGHNLLRRWVVHEVIEQKRAAIEALCRALGIRRLDLFGSAVGGSFDPDSSDVDVLVEFDVRSGFDYFGTYFGLKEGLERILGRPVDVVSVTSIRNPYFRDQVMRTRESLYAA
jgi:predicted nucleotidyltransferase